MNGLGSPLQPASNSQPHHGAWFREADRSASSPPIFRPGNASRTSRLRSLRLLKKDEDCRRLRDQCSGCGAFIETSLDDFDSNCCNSRSFGPREESSFPLFKEPDGCEEMRSFWDLGC